jgi:L-cysteine S-thiosulfotransferase
MGTLRLALVAAMTLATAAPHADGDMRRSGFEFMVPATQALQRDDGANPGMLWVAEGEDLWKRNEGPNARSCASCHGDARQSMRGVAARYPAFDATEQRPLDLGARIQACRQRHQGAAPYAAESQELLGLQSYISFQSRGLPVAPPADARLDIARARGERLYGQRIGQLDLACAQCHDEHAGQHLGGSTIPQAHAIGYPTYRLEWQGLGSLQRRLRNCMNGVRAEPYAYGAPELIELELYLATRDRGMALEAPAVRP